jgi:hypothetical protein
MTQSVYTVGPRTFQAGEDLEEGRRVKIESGTTTSPPEVIYAGAGEAAIGLTMSKEDDGDPIAVRLFTDNGTFLGVAADTFSIAATLYGAADGKISDTSSGSAIGTAMEAATAAGDIVEFVVSPVLATTAGTVSIADSGAFTSTATVEDALAEIYQHIATAQAFIPVPLVTCLESDATNATALTGSTTPILDMADGDTDSGLVLTWAASNSDAIIFQTPLPPSLDVTADVVIHFRAKSGGSTDTPTVGSDAYFNEGDTKVEDVSAALGSTVAEKTITIAAADVPAGAQTLTVELTPGAHTTDTVVLSAIWIEYTNSTLAS